MMFMTLHIYYIVTTGDSLDNIISHQWLLAGRWFSPPIKLTTTI